MGRRSRIQRAQNRLLAAAWIALGGALVAVTAADLQDPAGEAIPPLLVVVAVVAGAATVWGHASLYVVAVGLAATAITADGSPSIVLLGLAIGLALLPLADPTYTATSATILVAALLTAVLGVVYDPPLVLIALGVPVVWLASHLAASTWLDRIAFAELSEAEPEVLDEPTPGPSIGLAPELSASGFRFVASLRHTFTPRQEFDYDVWWDPIRRCVCEVSCSGFDLTTSFGTRRLLTCARPPARTPRPPSRMLRQHARPELREALASHDHATGLLRRTGLEPDDVGHDGAVRRVVGDNRDGNRVLAAWPLAHHVRERVLARAPDPPLLSLQDSRLLAWMPEDAGSIEG